MSEMPDRAAWLAGDLLLLSGEIFGAGEVSATVGEHAVDVATRTFELSSNGSGAPRVLAVSRFGEGVAGANLALSLGHGESADTERLGDWLMEPFQMISHELAPLAPETRTEALRFLWEMSAPNLDRPGSFPLAQLLARVQRELRPPLPPLVFTRDHPAAAHVDTVIRLSPRAVWARGWLHDRDGMVERLSLVAPEGGRADLTSGNFRYRRGDAEGLFGEERGADGQPHGFIRFTELDGPSQITTGWTVELETAYGGAVQGPVPDLESDPTTARDLILHSLREEPPDSEELIRHHVHPAMDLLQESARDRARIDTAVQLGEPPTKPSVTVIVPLYKELSFLEDQMAHWASDPQMAQEDLVYVLDSPEQAAELDELAHGLHSLYGIPFRIAVMRTNAGFAGVNNSAAELARAGKLLLLNSDVVPDTPGWLARMSAFYDATPGIGALGPKLLYEDDSIQHAGLYFHRAPGSELWENLHYYKGQHRHFPAANVARQVPAVTGACMMVSRQLYERVGGLSHRYVIGCEDSDFCLGLIDEGREHWYMPGAELYHLEDQPYPEDVRQRGTRYNTWLQSELWAERISELMPRFPGRAGRL